MVAPNPKSPLAKKVLEAFKGLDVPYPVRLLSEFWDKAAFGGATAITMSVGDLMIDISIRDPSENFDIELRCSTTGFWARASYLRNFLLGLNSYDEITSLAGLTGWLVVNFSNVYELICGKSCLERRAAFVTFAKQLDEFRHRRMIEKFRNDRSA